MSFCGHSLFMDLLLEAEYAFYWNLVSNSLLIRMVNRKPVFFFGHGHLANAMPRLLEFAMAAYFPGAQLALLDQADALSAGDLAKRASAQDHTLARAIENLYRSPSPAELVEYMVRESQKPHKGKAN